MGYLRHCETHQKYRPNHDPKTDGKVPKPSEELEVREKDRCQIGGKTMATHGPGIHVYHLLGIK